MIRFWTRRVGVMVTLKALGGVEFKSWLGHQLFWLRHLWFFLSPSGRCWDSALIRLWLLPSKSFPIIIHHSSHHFMPYEMWPDCGSFGLLMQLAGKYISKSLFYGWTRYKISATWKELPKCPYHPIHVPLWLQNFWKLSCTALMLSKFGHNSCVFGHYPSSSSLSKTQRFGDWILSLSSGKSLLSWAQSIEPVPVSGHQHQHKRRQNSVSETLCFKLKNRTLDNVEKLESCINIPLSQTFRSLVTPTI
jgi:hypothetical protein